MEPRKGDWIWTFTGRRFWPLDPHPEDVCIEDIAHSLAFQCRFAGHARRFYSVAQHSLIVSFEVPPIDGLWGLLHDASEAYLVDVPRPIKRCPEMAPYLEAEHRMMAAICVRFGLPVEEPESVRIADRQLLITEQRELMDIPMLDLSSIDPRLQVPADRQLQKLSPEQAEGWFLNRFWGLVHK